MFDFESCLKIGKGEYKRMMEPLIIKMGKLQREAKTKKIPVLIILEGLDASGKGAVMNELLMALDPRGYKVYSNNKDTEEELLRPFFWKFWKNLPGEGEIAVFDRSWYFSVIKNLNDMNKKEYKRRCQEIMDTETLLRNGKTSIIKFFLFISKEEQKKRFKKLDKNPSTSWRVTKEDWESNKNYDEILEQYEKLLDNTGNEKGVWNIVCSEDIDSAKVQIFQRTVAFLEKSIEQSGQDTLEMIPLKEKSFSLDSVNLVKSISRREYKKKLKKYKEKLMELEHEIYEKRIPVVLAYEGWDAAGKGGNIKRTVDRLDPRGYDVIPIAAPNDIEKKHHYMWRFWKDFPKGGHITIFDRTWYGRVLVERVEGFCKEEEWHRAYHEINSIESQWSDDGAVILKFWLHISKDEQLRRFKGREKTSYKNWKITEEDWRNREKWDLYKDAVEDMITMTSTENSEWHVIPGNSKRYARLKVMEIIIEELEKALKKREK
ncbi:polyphosphate:AMP phosphotransferase [uncultured Ilyobacter sp.]|uniref:polyphosphate:AMP phosphotransferase n=1 Tax=uncultured Ilyobacter sp. TaxID=544433 RepID=UPI0029C96103|nr:polyphosphate:AMP phosphotransferase [uncultured Ilyobacter sp.]